MTSPSIKALKKTLPNRASLTPLEQVLLLRWKPMNAPRGMNLWGLYLGTGLNYPVQLYTCPRTQAKTHIITSPGKPSLAQAQELLWQTLSQSQPATAQPPSEPTA